MKQIFAVLIALLALVMGSASLFAQAGPSTYIWSPVSAISATSPVSYKNGPLPSNFTIPYTVSGTVTACTFAVQGSLDGNTWFNISSSTACTSSGSLNVMNFPVPFLRVNVSAFTGTGSVTFGEASGAQFGLGVYGQAELYNATTDGHAVGNGIADDTAALTAACKAATAANRILYLPGLTYKVSGTVTCNPSSSTGNVVRILGVPEATTISSSSTTADILHIGNGQACPGLICGFIEGVKVAGPTSTPTVRSGQADIKLDAMTQFRIKEVDLSNTDIGVDMINNCYGTVLDNVRAGFFGSNNVGFYMRTGSQSGNQIFLNNSWISGALAAIYMAPNSDGLIINGGQYSMNNTTDTTQAVFMVGIDYLTSAVGGIGMLSVDGIDTEGAGGWWVHTYGQSSNVHFQNSDLLSNHTNPTEGVLKAETASSSNFRFENIDWSGHFAAAQPISISGDFGNTLLETTGWSAGSFNLYFNGVQVNTDWSRDPCVITNELAGSVVVHCKATYRPFNSTATTEYLDGVFIQGKSGNLQISTNAASASPTWKTVTAQ